MGELFTKSYISQKQYFKRAQVGKRVRGWDARLFAIGNVSRFWENVTRSDGDSAIFRSPL